MADDVTFILGEGAGPASVAGTRRMHDASGGPSGLDEQAAAVVIMETTHDG